MKAPKAGLVPNIHRESNPFYPDKTAEWVSKPPAVGNRRGITVDGAQEKPPLPPRRGTRKSQAGETEPDSSSSGEVSCNRKVPPPVPRKPQSFSSKQTESSMLASKSPEPLAAHRIQSFGSQSARSQLPISSVHSGEDYRNQIPSPEGSISSRRLPSRAAEGVGGLEDLLGGEDDKIGWKSLVP